MWGLVSADYGLTQKNIAELTETEKEFFFLETDLNELNYIFIDNSAPVAHTETHQ